MTFLLVLTCWANASNIWWQKHTILILCFHLRHIYLSSQFWSSPKKGTKTLTWPHKAWIHDLPKDDDSICHWLPSLPYDMFAAHEKDLAGRWTWFNLGIHSMDLIATNSYLGSCYAWCFTKLPAFGGFKHVRTPINMVINSTPSEVQWKTMVNFM